MIASYPDSLIRFRGSLIAAIQAKGINVHVVAPDLPRESEQRNRLESMGIIVHEISMRRTGTNPFNDLKTLIQLYLSIRQIRPEYILGYTVKPVIYGTLAGFFARVPHRFALITGLGYAFQGQDKGVARQLRSMLRGLLQQLYGLALNCSEKVFFQNPDDEGLFRQLEILKLKTPSVIVNGSGVDINHYTVVHSFEHTPKYDISFLMIARLLGDKGVREYVEAARRIKVQNPYIVFRLVGWIDENPDAIEQKELDNWISEGCIEFLGRLTDVRPAIMDCSVYVLPSYREGTPRTVLEAMAMGRPIITTDAPGCRETVVDSDNGFLVPVKSVEALEAAMLRFIDEPKLVVRMGQRSRAIAEEKYDVNKVNEVMLREMGIA